MAYIATLQEIEAAILDRVVYDYATGRLLWSYNKGKAMRGAFADYLASNGYLLFRIKLAHKRTTLMAHRVVWFIVHGVWPEHDIDHINCTRHDNRIENLRDITTSDNVARSGRQKDNGLPRGVTYTPQLNKSNPYMVQIQNRYVGYCATAEEAGALFDSEYAKIYNNDWRVN